MLPIYTVEQIRELERTAIEQGIGGDEMMARAGRAAFEMLQEKWPQAKSILVLCGNGNNGGDGYALALLAYAKAYDVKVRYVGDLNEVKHEALNVLMQCQAASLDIEPLSVDEEIEADVIVDALLGIGLQGEPRADLLSVIHAVNDTSLPVLALDVPSGLLADNGACESEAIVADCTITFIGLKQGMLTALGPDYCGELHVCDLDLPADVFAKVDCSGEVVDVDSFDGLVGERLHSEYKNDFGHVLVIGGAEGMEGAPLLAALGAARVGAGLVSVASLSAAGRCEQPEIMAHHIKSKKQLLPLLARATVVVIGPGLGQSLLAKRILKTVLALDLPILVDADALNLLSEMPVQRENWVLTPHPGEAARLLNKAASDVQAKRFLSAEKLQNQYNSVVVLKGCGTIIASDELPMICRDGTPALASGGTGDLLSGVIAGLIAQGQELDVAAALGVSLHARAGMMASKQGERGTLATDLLPYLRELVNKV